jgi:hypothetical protein
MKLLKRKKKHISYSQIMGGRLLKKHVDLLMLNKLMEK